MKEDCIFCRIAGRAADATVVYEDSQTLAFLDIHPLNPGHTLVIPKKHFTNMLEMPAEQAGRVFVSVAKVMRGVEKASKADGISIGQSNGKAASQEVFHMHRSEERRVGKECRSRWARSRYGERIASYV